MKKLKVRILETEDWYLKKLVGRDVTITKIGSDSACGSHQMRGTTDDGENLLLYGDQVEPLDVSDVPESHRGSLVLVQAWTFAEAKNDAWNRQPPCDLKAYREEYGKDWKDERVWDVGRL